MLTILAIAPTLFNSNGDAENALVLSARARWAGIPAEVVSEFEALPSLVVIGSGLEMDLEAMSEALAENAALLRACIEQQVPILAVGTGLELLGRRLETASGRWVEGLGILDAEAPLAAGHISGDLVVTSGFGSLIGYENHLRSWVPDVASTPLGTVQAGRGNNTPDKSEGILHGPIVGTHLHGPVLARNPALADHLLARATGEPLMSSPESTRVDAIAESARQAALSRMSR